MLVAVVSVQWAGERQFNPRAVQMPGGGGCGREPMGKVGKARRGVTAGGAQLASKVNLGVSGDKEGTTSSSEANVMGFGGKAEYMCFRIIWCHWLLEG